MKLPVIRFRKSSAKPVTKQSLSQFGQFHRLGQPLPRRHPAKRLHIQPSTDCRLKFHISGLYPKPAPKNRASARDIAE
jgi:hypothetical protein